MKIGILTHPVRCNYGGALQAYALQQYLQRRGYEAVIIDCHRKASVLSQLHHMVERNIFHRHFTRFATQYMCRTPRVVSDAHLQQVAADLDAVIVGSDQVWRLSMVRGVERHYFLDFAPQGARRIAYAASFGLSDLEPCEAQLYEDIKQLVSQFTAVSVREKDGVDICRKHWDIAATQVLDPTLLAGREVFDPLAAQAAPSAGTLFYYFLGNRSADVAQLQQIATAAGKRAFTVNAGKALRVSKFTFAFYPAVEKWVRAFRDADCVVTDSFHGVCFALLYRKPFYVLGHNQGGVSRITSILDMLGLRERYVQSLEALPTYDSYAAPTIDYDTIYSRLEALRNDSELFINNALKR